MHGAERFPEIQQIIRGTYSKRSYEGELEVELALWNDTTFGIQHSTGLYSCQSIRYCQMERFRDLKSISLPC